MNNENFNKLTDEEKRELSEPLKKELDSFKSRLNAASADDDGSIKRQREQITNSLEKMIGGSLEKQIEISRLSDEEWVGVSYRILSEAIDPFEAKNVYDRTFIALITVFLSYSRADLIQAMKDSLNEMKVKYELNYNLYVGYFAKYPFWGTIDPKQDDYDVFEKRATVLKCHCYDFLWFYRRLEDYLSKRTLYAVLLNWALLDINEISKVKSIFRDYFEPDIFPDNNGDIFVDLGAYIGDSTASYIETYGMNYNKIYAYEIFSEHCEKMRQNLAGVPNVEIRCKGAGKEHSESFFEVSEQSSSATQLSDTSEGQRVEIAALDDDLPDGFTFLKMDIEGSEYNALLGAEKTIRRCKPKLAVCIYHGYDDIWRIPPLIDEMVPEYKFYLRHNGGNLVPTEFVLLCNTN